MSHGVTLRSDYKRVFDGSVSRMVSVKAPSTETVSNLLNNCRCRVSQRKCLIKIRACRRKELSLTKSFLRNRGSGRDCDSLIMSSSFIGVILLQITWLGDFC